MQDDPDFDFLLFVVKERSDGLARTRTTECAGDIVENSRGVQIMLFHHTNDVIDKTTI